MLCRLKTLYLKKIFGWRNPGLNCVASPLKKTGTGTEPIGKDDDKGLSYEIDRPVNYKHILPQTQMP